MGFLRSLFLTGATASVISAIAVPSSLLTASRKRETIPSDPNCNSGPGWASVLFVGATGPDHDTSYVDWCETQFGHDYTPVTGIEVCSKDDTDGDRISGMRASLIPS